MFDEKVKRALLQRLPHAVCVVGCVSTSGEVNAFTVTLLTQTSIDPPVLTIAVQRRSRSNRFIKESKVFSVSFLGRSQADVAERLTVRSEDNPNKLASVAYHPGATGSPILNDCLGAVECSVIEIVEHGDHDVVLGELIATEAGTIDEEILLLQYTGWEYPG